MRYVRRITVTHKDGSKTSKESGNRDYINPKDIVMFLEKYSDAHPAKIEIEFC